MASGGAIAAAVICSLIGVPLVLFLLLFLLKKWMQGPTSGTDNQRKLDDKVVVITGKMKRLRSCQCNGQHSKCSLWTDLNGYNTAAKAVSVRPFSPLFFKKKKTDLSQLRQ